MVNRRALLWAGLALLVVGGALLAFGTARAWTAAGTTMGLAGLGLIAWAWAGLREDE